MLHALKTLWPQRGEKRRDDAQLGLTLDVPRASEPPPPPAPRDAGEMLGRLRSLGLVRIERCQLTRNRSVMVSHRGGVLRVHDGYLTAPDDVLRAIVIFIEGRTRAERKAARRRIVSHSAGLSRAPVRRGRTRPEDEPLAASLTEWHARYNAEHFGGTLEAVPVRVSRRMKSRLGHYSAAVNGGPAEIAISFGHLRRHGWEEALQTLLHEMVHQWQDETGRPIDHGGAFRAKAREVGIAASARRSVGASASGSASL